MKNDIDLHLGRRVRWRRRLLNLTQADVAARCGVGFQQIQKYESAANSMSASMLWRISRALETNVEFFYSGLAVELAGDEISLRSRPGSDGPG